MSLFDIKKVDLITESPQDNEFNLVIVIEKDEWINPNKFKLNFQEKIINYVMYIKDGQMQREYPESIGKKISITIFSTTEIPKQYLKIIKIMKKKLKNYDIDLKTIIS